MDSKKKVVGEVEAAIEAVAESLTVAAATCKLLGNHTWNWRESLASGNFNTRTVCIHCGLIYRDYRDAKDLKTHPHVFKNNRL